MPINFWSGAWSLRLQLHLMLQIHLRANAFDLDARLIPARGLCILYWNPEAEVLGRKSSVGFHYANLDVRAANSWSCHRLDVQAL